MEEEDGYSGHNRATELEVQLEHFTGGRTRCQLDRRELPIRFQLHRVLGEVHLDIVAAERRRSIPLVSQFDVDIDLRPTQPMEGPPPILLPTDRPEG